MEYTARAAIRHRSQRKRGDRSWEQDYWVWPLPPEGPLTFIVSWPSQGVNETSYEFDATELRQRAEEAESLWPTSEPVSEGGPERYVPILDSLRYVQIRRRLNVMAVGRFDGPSFLAVSPNVLVLAGHVSLVAEVAPEVSEECC